MEEHNRSSAEGYEPFTFETIRRNIGMFVGGQDEQAILRLIQLLIDETLRFDWPLQSCRQIRISIHPNGSCSIADDAQPLYLQDPIDAESLPWLMASHVHRTSSLHSHIHVVNAVSEWFSFEIFTGSQHYRQVFQHGVPTGPLEALGPTRHVGKSLQFLPDATLFQRDRHDLQYGLLGHLRTVAALTPGLAIQFEDQRQGVRNWFQYQAGVKSYLHELEYFELNYTAPLYLQQRTGDYQVEVAFNWCYERPLFLSFVNHVQTIRGGTHERGFWRGFMRGLRRYLQMEPSFGVSAVPIRKQDIQPYVRCIVALHLEKPQWVGPIKRELATPEAENLVAKVVEEEVPKKLKDQHRWQQEKLAWILWQRSAK